MERILLLYTGGTIGCEGEPLAPMSAARFAQQLAERGTDLTDVELRTLPEPLDSANMQPSDWLDIADSLLTAWADFDGFVVLHGTDTLAYTASALSFFLVGIDKPVVLTGSQHPLAVRGSDAPGNLTDAIATARMATLHEVVVCFAGQILRGNRCIKRSASALDAFSSPNWPLLGEVKLGKPVLYAEYLLPQSSVVFEHATVRAALVDQRSRLAACQVWAIHLHPGFPSAVLQAALTLPEPPRGWVLACFGGGNAPGQRAFVDALRAARERGVLVLAVTQTGHGAVNFQTYAAGAGLALAGVVSGRDLTLPAAVSKLQWLLLQDLAQEEMLVRLSESVAGEMN